VKQHFELNKSLRKKVRIIMPKIYYFSTSCHQDTNITLKELLGSYDIHEISTDSINTKGVLIKESLDYLLSKKLSDLQGFIKSVPVQDKTPLLKSGNEKGFVYNSVIFNNDTLNIIAGLNAVDNSNNVEKVFALLNYHNIKCARMGVYKPRTNPYTFQGRGKLCLNNIFSLADKYDIKAIAMEVLSERHVDEILNCLTTGNYNTGVILQIGTRNAQNYELLKYVGSIGEHPVLYKRGFGISFAESVQACEYIAKSGNKKIIFCLRGLKSYHAAPHRNICDFAHIPVVKRELGLLTCADPSHAIGEYNLDTHNISDIAHVTAQAVIAGANCLLIDIHPTPSNSLVDHKQAIDFEQFNLLLSDISLCRKSYIQRQELYSSAKAFKLKPELALDTL
jgi:3-deoxy-7-phosphoheptulonate synthase